MSATVQRIHFVTDHIKASYPCSFNSVVNWCIHQGLEREFGPAIASMMMSREIEIELEDGVVIINPL